METVTSYVPRCPRCGAAYCHEHGGELCAACLDPISAAPSSTVFRTTLFGMLVFSVLALHEQVLPPTMHLEVPDPDCDLDYVANAARPVQDLEAALSNSIGLGGHNAALVFGRVG